MKLFSLFAHTTALLFIGSLSISGDAYELRTHAALTFEAYSRSNLARNPQTLEDLGFTADKARQLGTIYYDVQGNSARVRNINDFELNRMPQDVQGLPLSIPGYLTRGTIREDDLSRFPGCFANNFLQNHQQSRWILRFAQQFFAISLAPTTATRKMTLAAISTGC